jgi:hypothetical protein
MFSMIKDLKVVLGKGKGGGIKKIKKAEKNAKKNIENNDNETSVLFKKKVNIFEPTILEGLDDTSCKWRRICVKHWSVPCWIYLAKPKMHLMHG